MKILGEFSPRPALTLMRDQTVQSRIVTNVNEGLKGKPCGLSSAEARKRLAEYGPNELAPARHASTAIQIISMLERGPTDW